ncbi:hypothetical protein [Halomarina ordinaria]|uniref:Uncharacterized protein n=1 Tax=Halomarina ordinaria TaxID=3033939 RepID=A0ABD5UDT2_9EURY|nr:hypothetical protein [Halomarina sp. PSRA2]
MDLSRAVGALRRPEYTGENRCLPCTVVNVAIALALAVLVRAASRRTGPGVVVFLASSALVYLRGYLVPGTPTLTERYFPPWLLRLFGKEPIAAVAVDGTTDPAASASPDAGHPLVAAGVLVRDGDGFALPPAVREDWREEIRAVRGSAVDGADVRALFDADAVSRTGERSFVVDGSASVRWDSEAALVADVACARVLRTHGVEWDALDRERRQSLLLGLRLSLERCPACDGALDRGEERVDPCCQRPHLVAEAVCSDCGALVADAAVVAAEGEGAVRERLLRQ